MALGLAVAVAATWLLVAWFGRHPPVLSTSISVRNRHRRTR